MTCSDCELKLYGASKITSSGTGPLEELFRYNFRLDTSLLTPALQPLFIENTVDSGTKAFLRRCEANTATCWRITLDAIGSIVLRPFVSRTSFNGILHRGAMHVLSTEQFIRHLGRQPGTPGRLLDIGAGDGGVTACMAPLFDDITTTESDRVMQWRLARRGYRSFTPEQYEVQCENERFDAIACFNVLDRCDTPLKLLRRLRSQLAPGGTLLLAVVFPFRPFVENGTRRDTPQELIIVTGKTMEENINSFVADTLVPNGFVVESFSRAPYLCEGDNKWPYYILNDIVFALKAA